MKALVCVALALTCLAGPAVTFAQSNAAPLTRAQVRADLVKVEQVGYSPSSGESSNYPSDIQLAEAKIAARDEQVLLTAAVGGTPDGSTAVGYRIHTDSRMGTRCVGPVSFCNPYLGG